MGKNFGQIDVGQGGSAHIKLADKIVPPFGKVITAIHFLAANTPTVLKSEDDTQFFNTEGGSAKGTVTTAINMAGNLSGAKAIFDSLTGVKIGDELIMNEIAAGTTITVLALNPDEDNANECTLSASVTANDDAVASFRRPAVGQAGAGGVDLTSVEFPANSFIYGRWVEFVPSAAACIVYFGE